MYLYCINIYENGQKIASKKNLDKFGFFERKTIGEFMDFFSSTLIKESTGNLFSVDEKSYRIHIFKKNDMAYAIITDQEYPDYCVRDIYMKVNKTNIDTVFSYYLHGAINDPLKQINNDVNEIKKIMISSIDKVLDRGEKLDILIDKSEELDESSKRFLKRAKKLNSCCVVS